MSELENIQALLHIYVLDSNRLYGWELAEKVFTFDSEQLAKRAADKATMQAQCRQAEVALMEAIANFGNIGDFLQTAFLNDETEELDLTMDDV